MGTGSLENCRRGDSVSSMGGMVNYRREFQVTIQKGNYWEGRDLNNLKRSCAKSQLCYYYPYENGMRVLTLKKLLGHENLAVTMMYLYTAMKFDVEEYERTGLIGE